MSIEATSNITGTTLQVPPPATEKIEISRKIAQEKPEQVETSTAKTVVQPEEILSKIKALAQDGMYSVNFEVDPKTNQLIMKLVDSQTKEVIRQIPAQEVLGLREALTKAQGNIVNATL